MPKMPSRTIRYLESLECCATCKYRSYSYELKDIICKSPESSAYGQWTDINDYCGCWDEIGRDKHGYERNII